MGRSQRHLLQEHNTTSAGEVHAQGEIATSVVTQVGGTPVYGELDMRGLDLTVPEGPSGGPLQGSSMSGAIPENMAPIPGPEPEPGFEPTIVSLNPNTAVIGGADIEMHVTGTNFSESSIIYFNNGAEPTTFVSDTDVSTIVRPSTAGVAGAFPVTVGQGSYRASPLLDFTFTDVGAGRSVPIGPVAISLIEDDPAGLAVTVAEPIDVQIGDTVLIEASFDSNVNGSCEVLSVDGNTIVVANDYVLETPIENKGRVTVTAEA
jgi:hypothetical protein